MGIIYRQGHNGRLSVQEMDDNFHFIENSLSGLSSLEVGLSASLSTLATLEHLDVAGLTASILGLSMSISNISLNSGATGSQGPAGATGSQGPTGATGSQGPAGATGSQGPAGATGSQGSQGLEGPVGVSGLTWQGGWSDNSLYNMNDAVGYASASWWCVATVSSTASVVAPDLDTTHINWTLLAAQGSQGPLGEQGVQGSQGIQGPTGPQGIEGPVGVSGLTWQGGWSDNSLYNMNDAVGYASASWWCVATVSSTASVVAPDLDTTHINWTLLAAQGSQGPQGPSGVLTKTEGNVYSSQIGYSDVVILSYDINTLLDGGYHYNKFKLPNCNVVGREIIVLNNFSTPTFVWSSGVANNYVDLYSFTLGATIVNAVNSWSSQIRSYYGERLKFTCTGTNYWIVEQFVQNAPSINGKLIGGQSGFYTHVAGNATASLSTSNLNAYYPDYSTQYGFQVVCKSIIGGGLSYIKTGTASWASTPILDNTLAAGPTSSGIVPSLTTKTFKTIITTAQVLQLFTTPVIILPYQSGVTRIPTHVYIKRNTGTAYTLNTNSFLVLDQFNSDTNTNINPNPLTNTAGYCSNTIFIQESVAGGFYSGDYKLKAAGGDPTLGTGNLDVYVTYEEFFIG